MSLDGSQFIDVEEVARVSQPLPSKPICRPITDEDLGACKNCPRYRDQRPHQWQADGSLQIVCEPRGHTDTRKDIGHYTQCDDHKKRRMLFSNR